MIYLAAFDNKEDAAKTEELLSERYKVGERTILFRQQVDRFIFIVSRTPEASDLAKYINSWRAEEDRKKSMFISEFSSGDFSGTFLPEFSDRIDGLRKLVGLPVPRPPLQLASTKPLNVFMVVFLSEDDAEKTQHAIARCIATGEQTVQEVYRDKAALFLTSRSPNTMEVSPLVANLRQNMYKTQPFINSIFNRNYAGTYPEELFAKIEGILNSPSITDSATSVSTGIGSIAAQTPEIPKDAPMVEQPPVPAAEPKAAQPQIVLIDPPPQVLASPLPDRAIRLQDAVGWDHLGIHIIRRLNLQFRSAGKETSRPTGLSPQSYLPTVILGPLGSGKSTLAIATALEVGEAFYPKDAPKLIVDAGLMKSGSPLHAESNLTAIMRQAQNGVLVIENIQELYDQLNGNIVADKLKAHMKSPNAPRMIFTCPDDHQPQLSKLFPNLVQVIRLQHFAPERFGLIFVKKAEREGFQCEPGIADLVTELSTKLHQKIKHLPVNGYLVDAIYLQTVLRFNQRTGAMREHVPSAQASPMILASDIPHDFARPDALYNARTGFEFSQE